MNLLSLRIGLRLTASLVLFATTAWAKDVPPAMVTCELKWVEAPRQDVNHLFGSTDFVVTADQLRQLNQWIDAKKARILAQPRISTINVAQAQVQSVWEMIYPSTWRQPASDVTPTMMEFFRTRNVGTILNVTPVVSADRSRISITMVPELSFLMGLRRFEVQGVAGKPKLEQPDVFVWNQQSNFELTSGSTVLLTIFENPPQADHSKVVLLLFSAAINAIQGEQESAPPTRPLPEQQGRSNTLVSTDVRWVEMPRGEFNKLLPSTAYVLTAEHLRTVDELITRKQAAVLAQPRLTAFAGELAQVRCVNEFIYPTETYDINTETTTSPTSIAVSNLTVNVHVQTSPSPPRKKPVLAPCFFRSREVGHILNLKATVYPGDKWIGCTLVPEHSSLSGLQEFADYGPQGPGKIQAPKFRTYSTQTEVVLRSGQTVLVSVHDGVPVPERDNVILVLLGASLTSRQ